MTRIDLNARRAQVREAKGESVEIVVDDLVLHAPVEMPIMFAQYTAQMDIPAAARELFGDQAEAFLKTRPSMQDLEAIMQEAYGIDMGEAQGPPPYLKPFPSM
ncbi:hypothetical protein AB0P21_09765 [Kribbella sp. NPDC056861]|uniref:hypothetical protein n=1 Tax=Kribbella sp. NPDC056861 TaxID=3154857 RepID=UPI00343559A3